MVTRRSLLVSSLVALPAMQAQALQKSSLADPLRVGVDLALAESGVATALQKSFARDTGIAVQLVPMPALPLLEALNRGELDAGLTNTPEAELKLDRQGLVHDRRAIAVGDFVIVGPQPVPKADPLADVPRNDAVAMLRRLAELGKASQSDPAAPKIVFLSAADGSGTHGAEQGVWAAAQIAPAGAWYVPAVQGSSLIAQARALGAYAVVERGAWDAQGGKPLVLRVEGDPRLAETVHVMRAFRVNHPAGKLFVEWISDHRGRRVVAQHRGYRPA